MRTDENYLKKELEVSIGIAKKAGEIMLEYFEGDQEVSFKDDGSSVTIADKKINHMVIEELAAKFPNDAVIGEEESNGDFGMGRKWFCDPIDGTEAFVWGVPTAMFSLALIIDGRPVMGVAYDPFLDRMYTAIKGRGSYCNGKSLKVSEKNLQNGLLAVTSNIRKIYEPDSPIKNAANSNIRIAVICGAVYKSVLVASGKLAGHFADVIANHDVAAVELIICEAGGKVTDYFGNELDYSKTFKGAVISNGIIHEDILGMIRNVSQ